jgi:archaellum component FlaC
MTPLELLAILVIAGAVVVLFYFYMQENGNLSFSRARSFVFETGEKARSSVSGIGDKVEGNNMVGVGETMSGMGEKASGMGDKVRSTVSGADEKISGDSSMMGGVSEKMSEVSEKLKGTVKGVPKSTDSLSNKIDLFLDEKSDQLIKDWELATKDDILNIEKRYTKVSRDLGELDGRFNEYRGSTNKKLKKIEERLKKLENIEE